MTARRRRREKKYGNTADARLVARVMKVRGLDQEAIGRRLGLTQGMVSHFLTERRPLSFLARKELHRALTEAP